MMAVSRIELLLYRLSHIARFLFYMAHRNYTIRMFHVKHFIKRGIGALYELCAPSFITHYALRITHFSKAANNKQLLPAN